MLRPNHIFLKGNSTFLTLSGNTLQDIPRMTPNQAFTVVRDAAEVCCELSDSSTMRSIRRSGSAAPHNNWSPTVKADRYCPPIGSLRRRERSIQDAAKFMDVHIRTHLALVGELARCRFGSTHPLTMGTGGGHSPMTSPVDQPRRCVFCLH